MLILFYILLFPEFRCIPLKSSIEIEIIPNKRERNLSFSIYPVKTIVQLQTFFEFFDIHGNITIVFYLRTKIFLQKRKKIVAKQGC